VGSGYADGGPSVQLNIGAAQQFISPLVTVNVQAGQSVYVSASAMAESTAMVGVSGVAIGLSIAYQPTGGTLTNATGGENEALLGEITEVVSLSAVISGLAPGTYQVGLAGSAAGLLGGPSILAAHGATAALVFQS
jgi:hypothetical protein